MDNSSLSSKCRIFVYQKQPFSPFPHLNLVSVITRVSASKICHRIFIIVLFKYSALYVLGISVIVSGGSIMREGDGFIKILQTLKQFIEISLARMSLM